MKKRYDPSAVERGVRTGDYPPGFTFKDLLNFDWSQSGLQTGTWGLPFPSSVRPMRLARNNNCYPPGTTKEDLQNLENDRWDGQITAWDALVTCVSQKRRTSTFCDWFMANRVHATPAVIFALRPLGNGFHADVLDILQGRIISRTFPKWKRKLFAENTQVFCYLLQNYPGVAKLLLPYREPLTDALALVKQRFDGPVVKPKRIRPDSQTSRPEAFADMIVAYPELIKSLNPHAQEFHRQIWDAVFSKKLKPEKRAALAATGPDALAALL